MNGIAFVALGATIFSFFFFHSVMATGALGFSIEQFLADVRNPDATVQHRNGQIVAEMQQRPLDAARVLLPVVASTAANTTMRQTAAVVLKQVVRGSISQADAAAVAAEIEEALVLTMGDRVATIQSAASSVAAVLLKACGGITGWTTLLPRLASVASEATCRAAQQPSALEMQQVLATLRGVLRCLQILFEDCTSSMADVCSSMDQLCTLSDLIEACLRVAAAHLSSGPLTAPDAVQLLQTGLIAVGSMFSCGVVPQSEYVWAASDSDDDDADVSSPLAIQGTSPLRRRDAASSSAASSRPSKSQRRLERTYILQRLKKLIDSVVDAARAGMACNCWFPPIAAQQPSHVGSDGSSGELVVLELCSQLTGYYDRVAVFLREALPRFLQFVDGMHQYLRSCSSSSTNSGIDGIALAQRCSSISIAAMDLISELCHCDSATSLIESNLPLIVSALLNASVLDFQQEAVELFGAESDVFVADDPSAVLTLVSRRGSAALRSAATARGHEGGDDAADQEEEDDLVMDSGESEGSRRDAIAWCLNNLSSQMGESLVTALIPVLVQAAVSAVQGEEGQPMVYEAILFALSEIIDEILVHIPQQVVYEFLRQCMGAVAPIDVELPDGIQPSRFRHIACVRRQAVRCLERAAVGSMNLADSGADDDVVVGLQSVVDPAVTLRLLMRCASTETNKMTRFAIIRGIQNIITHALQVDDADEDEDGDVDDGNDADATGSPVTDPSLLYGITQADVASLYQFILASHEHCPATALRCRVALWQLLAKLVEVDLQSTCVMSCTTDPSVRLGVLNGCVQRCRDLFTELSSNSSISGAAVCEVLVVLETLCDVIEIVGEQVAEVVPALWSLGCDAVAFLRNSRLGGTAELFQAELLTAAFDLLSACCDALRDSTDCASLALLFADSNVVSLCFDIAASARGSDGDPALLRACFGLLGDFLVVGAVDRVGLESVSDSLFGACVQEAFIKPSQRAAAAVSTLSSPTTPLFEQRWASMDARSNALFCLSHLLELCTSRHQLGLNASSSDVTSLMAVYFPSITPEQLDWICVSAMVQLQRSVVDNIHRTMKLNVLFVASVLATITPRSFLERRQATTERGESITIGGVEDFIVNAAYFLPHAEDAEEVVKVLRGLGTFLTTVVPQEPSIAASLRTQPGVLQALAKLCSLLGRKAVTELRLGKQAPLVENVTTAWRFIAGGLLVVDNQSKTLIATATTGLNKKELAQLQKFVRGGSAT